jgi:16S rRNA (guanine(527)-N(7))-methyltransferase RsmG
VGAAESPTSVQALWRVPQWFPHLQPAAMELLRLFHVELLHFNAKVNLIGRGTERDADETHFADCIMGAEMMLKHCKYKEILDIGSGNGLPGIAIAILDPQRQVKLIERDQRKAEFLKQIVFRLKLPNVVALNAAFEELPQNSIDAAVSRGFASISRAVLAGNKCFHKDSCYYHFKTNTWSREVADIPSQICAVWSPELVGEYSLPDNQARRAVVATRKIV